MNDGVALAEVRPFAGWAEGVAVSYTAKLTLIVGLLAVSVFPQAIRGVVMLASSPPNDIVDLVANQVMQEKANYLPSTRYVWASDLLKMKFEDDPVIGGVLGKGESLLLCGQCGCGKSTMTLNKALVLAAPPLTGLWGLPVPRPFKSLFVQAENSAAATQKRLQAILNAQPGFEPAIENIAFAGEHCRLVGSLTDEDFCNQLADMIEKTGAEVIFLDPLISYHSADENDNAAMRRTLDRLSALQEETKTTVILVHHHGKERDIGAHAGRGASAIADWAANIVNMTSPKQAGDSYDGEKIIKLSFDKLRNYEGRPPLYLKFGKDLIFHPVDDPTAQKDENQIVLVMAALQDMGGTADSQKELIVAVKEKVGCEDTQAHKMIRDAVDQGRVFEEKAGRTKSYTLNKPTDSSQITAIHGIAPN